eukprot:278597_1
MPATLYNTQLSQQEYKTSDDAKKATNVTWEDSIDIAYGFQIINGSPAEYCVLLSKDKKNAVKFDSKTLNSGYSITIKGNTQMDKVTFLDTNNEWKEILMDDDNIKIWPTKINWEFLNNHFATMTDGCVQMGKIKLVPPPFKGLPPKKTLEPNDGVIKKFKGVAKDTYTPTAIFAEKKAVTPPLTPTPAVSLFATDDFIAADGNGLSSSIHGIALSINNLLDVDTSNITKAMQTYTTDTTDWWMAKDSRNWLSDIFGETAPSTGSKGGKNYKGNKSYRQNAPNAQNFYQNFGYGFVGNTLAQYAPDKGGFKSISEADKAKLKNFMQYGRQQVKGYNAQQSGYAIESILECDVVTDPDTNNEYFYVELYKNDPKQTTTNTWALQLYKYLKNPVLINGIINNYMGGDQSKEQQLINNYGCILRTIGHNVSFEYTYKAGDKTYTDKGSDAGLYFSTKFLKYIKDQNLTFLLTNYSKSTFKSSSDKDTQYSFIKELLSKLGQINPTSQGGKLSKKYNDELIKAMKEEFGGVVGMIEAWQVAATGINTYATASYADRLKSWKAWFSGKFPKWSKTFKIAAAGLLVVGAIFTTISIFQNWKKMSKLQRAGLILSCINQWGSATQYIARNYGELIKSKVSGLWNKVMKSSVDDCVEEEMRTITPRGELNGEATSLLNGEFEQVGEALEEGTEAAAEVESAIVSDAVDFGLKAIGVAATGIMSVVAWVSWTKTADDPNATKTMKALALASAIVTTGIFICQAAAIAFPPLEICVVVLIIAEFFIGIFESKQKPKPIADQFMDEVLRAWLDDPKHQPWFQKPN